MAVPPEFVGAWRRCGVLSDGVRVIDYQDVIWLQTPSVYADIRLPIDSAVTPGTHDAPDFFTRTGAFAGTSDWEAPLMTWNRPIDSNLDSGPDSNHIELVRGVAFETGTATSSGSGGARAVPFAEEWLCMTDADVAWSARLEDAFVRVEIATWAIEILDARPDGGHFRAQRFDLVGSRWCLAGTVES